MMRLKNLFILSMAIMLFSAVGVSAAGTNTKQSEIELEKQIYKKILTLTNYGVFDSIGFELDGDTVILSGKVYNAINRRTAENRVAKLEGVAKVVNNIELLPPSGFDDNIRRRALRSLAGTGGIYRYLIGPTPSMRIIVDRGHLTLEGFVSNRGDVRIANILAQSVPGVFSVTNNLQLADNLKY